jgi:hypothetical protein
LAPSVAACTFHMAFHKIPKGMSGFANDLIIIINIIEDKIRRALL